MKSSARGKVQLALVKSSAVGMDGRTAPDDVAPPGHSRSGGSTPDTHHVAQRDDEGQREKPDPLAEISALSGFQARWIANVLPRKRRANLWRVFWRRGIGRKRARKICAPRGELREFLSWLARLLASNWKPSVTCHGYVRGRSALTAAQLHVGDRYRLTVDIRQFFPSIAAERVRAAMRVALPRLSEAAASLLADACCHAGRLPEGAPTSPILSVIVCDRLDTKLRRICSPNPVSRYADDVAISWTADSAAGEAGVEGDRARRIKADLSGCLASEGFALNERKTRLTPPSRPHRYLGLVISDRIDLPSKNLRQIDSMLRACEKYGFRSARKDFMKLHGGAGQDFLATLRGRIARVAEVRGEEDARARDFAKRLAKIVQSDPDAAMHARCISIAISPKDSFGIVERAIAAVRADCEYEAARATALEFMSADYLSRGSGPVPLPLRKRSKRSLTFPFLYRPQGDQQRTIDQAFAEIRLHSDLRGRRDLLVYLCLHFLKFNRRGDDLE